MKEIYDIAIIGGGPAGIFASYYAQLRNLKTCVIESLPSLGGQPNTLYAQKKIYDVAGFLGITGEELTQKLTEQTNIFNYDIFTETTIKEIIDENDIKILKSNNSDIYAKTVIIAIGNGAFNPRKLAVEYGTDLKNNIDYFVTDINKYKNKDVLVAGGGDSAVDWSIAINEIANSTSIVHRRDNFRALESSVNKLNSSNIKKITPYLIGNVEKAAENRVKVTLSKARDKEIKSEIVVDYLLVNYGYTSDSKLLRDWGLELTGPYIKVNQKMETNLPNIYAIGDVAEYDGKLKLIANAFSEGPIAVAQAQNKIYPEKSYYEHSTNLFDNI
ncbi:NAD(P)/FAD-dependent oxidoreductase [Companilactobacillus sp. DQM5]|uniref:NAD(P)/FAD-dependent oxidoreductase n=1 Tax=Companilactobacillus sp. DQM5 TaxID=3463359 RepID=UPI00405905EC